MNRTSSPRWTGISLALVLLAGRPAQGGAGTPSSAATALPPAASRAIVARVGTREIQTLLLSDAVEEAVNSG